MSALQLVVVTLAVLAGLGSAAAFLSAGRQAGRIAALRGDVTDRDRRIDFLEAENARHEETVRQQNATIAHLRGEITTLRDVVTGASGPTQQLLGLIEAHHQASLAEWARLRQGQKDILKLVGAQRTADGNGET